MTRQYTRYTNEELSAVVAECTSFAEVARRFGKSPRGGTITHLKRMCVRLAIDTTHMIGQGHMRGKRSNRRLLPSERLVMGVSSDHRTAANKLRQALIDVGVPHLCNICGMEPMWNNHPLVLEIDHIDECYWNNTQDNLQFICPNCHTQKTAGTLDKTM